MLTANAAWRKMWVVIRRPYILIAESERDHILRLALNLSSVKIQHGLDQESMIAAQNVFCVFTKHRGILFQVSSHHDVGAVVSCGLLP